MKRIFTLCIAVCTFMTGFAQKDSTGKNAPDTIRIGGMIIIRDKNSKPGKDDENRSLRITSRKNNEKRSNISTNWWIVDLGFSNYKDNTLYSSVAAQAYAPGSNNTWF